MFFGTHTVKVDAKNRASVPAPFRNHILGGSPNFKGGAVFPSLNAGDPAYMGFSPDHLDTLDARIRERGMSRNWLGQRERGSLLLMRIITWIALNIGRPAGRLLLTPISLYSCCSPAGRARLRASICAAPCGRNMPSAMRRIIGGSSPTLCSDQLEDYS